MSSKYQTEYAFAHLTDDKCLLLESTNEVGGWSILGEVDKRIILRIVNALNFEEQRHAGAE